MEISDSVRLSIRDYLEQEYESAMIHAGHAIEGTASKIYNKNTGSNYRFTTLLRDNYDIFGTVVMPGVDFAASRFRVTLDNPKAPNGLPDIADIIYGKHRCSHDHGQALPREYEFIDGDGEFPCMYIGRDQVKFSRRVILGMLLVAILSPVNSELACPKLDGIGIALGIDEQKWGLIINDWWGQAERFRTEILPRFPEPKLVFDCSKIENQPE